MVLWTTANIQNTPHNSEKFELRKVAQVFEGKCLHERVMNACGQTVDNKVNCEMNSANG